MEAFGVSAQQKPDDPGDPTKRDNLYEPRSDGQVRGRQDVHVRRSSLFLDAQTDPLRLPLAAGAAGLRFLSQAAERLDTARWRSRRR
jgi:hypothetical protein